MIGLWLCKLGEFQLILLLRFQKLMFLEIYIKKLLKKNSKQEKPNNKFYMTPLLSLRPKICTTIIINFTNLKEKQLVCLLMLLIRKKAKILFCSIEVLFILHQEVKFMILDKFKLENRPLKSQMYRKLENASCISQIKRSIKKKLKGKK